MRPMNGKEQKAAESKMTADEKAERAKKSKAAKQAKQAKMQKKKLEGGAETTEALPEQEQAQPKVKKIDLSILWKWDCSSPLVAAQNQSDPPSMFLRIGQDPRPWLRVPKVIEIEMGEDKPNQKWMVPDESIVTKGY